MSDPLALAAFLDKWRKRWPEWNVAEVFIAQPERATAAAWFALLQELTDAAWAGEDPRPGEAKLGWWAEELIGWSQGRRRHPLGLVLQRMPAPWTGLAAALPSLLASRDAAATRDDAVAGALPFAEAIALLGAALFHGAHHSARVEVVLARQLLLRGDAAVPLQVRARIGDAMVPPGLSRAWAAELLASWPATHPGSRPERIFSALLRERIRRVADGDAPTGWMSALWGSWRAARA